MCDTEKLNNITAENYYQGICGFVSSLCLVYSNRGSIIREIPVWSMNDPDPNPNQPPPESAKRRKWYISEIKLFLEYLKNQNPDLLLKIQKFTKSFPSYEHFDIDQYYNGLYALLNNRNDYSIGLPYKAVQEYLEAHWGVRTTLNDPDDPNTLEKFKDFAKIPGNSIVGLHNCAGDLRHYVYVNNNKIYSCGKEYDSINGFMSDNSGEDYCYHKFGVIQIANTSLPKNETLPI